MNIISSVINGKTINMTSSGNISIINGVIYENGKKVSEESNDKIINIVIQGDVGDLAVDYCSKIEVTGNSKKLKQLPAI